VNQKNPMPPVALGMRWSARLLSALIVLFWGFFYRRPSGRRRRALVKATQHE
jgi:hypothetical protein